MWYSCLVLAIGLGAVVILVIGIAKGPAESQWFLNCLFLSLTMLILGGLTLHLDNKRELKTDHWQEIQKLESNHRKEKNEWEMAQIRKERLEFRQSQEKAMYRRDIAEYGEQIARVRRLERRLDLESK